MTEIQRVKAGVLVSLKTRNRGNISYWKDTVQYPTAMPGGAIESEWNTRKRVADPEEQKEAERVRDKAKDYIRGICARTEHGLLCPLEDKQELIDRIAEARGWVEEFNATAARNHVKVSVVLGEVLQDDVEATRAIFGEIEEFLDEMAVGMAELDVKKVRDICARAVNMNQMLDGESSATLELVIKTARAACTRIVKAGNEVGNEVERNTVRLIRNARTQFLDLDDVGAYTAPSGSGGRALDLVV
jgi:hypothetical protein